MRPRSASGFAGPLSPTRSSSAPPAPAPSGSWSLSSLIYSTTSSPSFATPISMGSGSAGRAPRRCPRRRACIRRRPRRRLDRGAVSSFRGGQRYVCCRLRRPHNDPSDGTSGSSRALSCTRPRLPRGAPGGHDPIRVRFPPALRAGRPSRRRALAPPSHVRLPRRSPRARQRQRHQCINVLVVCPPLGVGSVLCGGSHRGSHHGSHYGSHGLSAPSPGLICSGFAS